MAEKELQTESSQNSYINRNSNGQNSHAPRNKGAQNSQTTRKKGGQNSYTQKEQARKSQNDQNSFIKTAKNSQQNAQNSANRIEEQGQRPTEKSPRVVEEAQEAYPSSSANKVPTPSKIQQRWTAKDLENSISKTINTLSLHPTQTLSKEQWDSFLSCIHQHWVANKWSDSSQNTKYLSALLQIDHTLGQTLQSFLINLNIGYANNLPLATTFDLETFNFEENVGLERQLIKFMKLLRTHYSDHTIDYTDIRAHQHFERKIKHSPFYKAWYATRLLPSTDQMDLSQLVNLSTTNTVYPTIKEPAQNPFLPLNPKGREYQEAQEKIDNSKCYICYSPDHKSEDCSILTGFHKRHTSIYHHKDWNRPTKQHCIIHGHCAHSTEACKAIPPLRADNNLQFKKRKREQTNEDSNKKQKLYSKMKEMEKQLEEMNKRLN